MYSTNLACTTLITGFTCDLHVHVPMSTDLCNTAGPCIINNSSNFYLLTNYAHGKKG